ncbi:unnamed protein product, partial [Ectocarpus sp. 12 AP-2014]
DARAELLAFLLQLDRRSDWPDGRARELTVTPCRVVPSSQNNRGKTKSHQSTTPTVRIILLPRELAVTPCRTAPFNQNSRGKSKSHQSTTPTARIILSRKNLEPSAGTQPLQRQRPQKQESA